MSIPHGFIQELLTRVDVVDVVGRYVQLKKTGSNLSGLCPFHGEKTPSFTVSPSKQFYHCFGCGKNGDAINFLMEHNGLGFIDAVQELAQQYGMPVPDDRVTPQDRALIEAQRKKQTSLADVLETAATSYKKQLKKNPPAIAYLKQRGLSGEIAARYGLGYAPAGWRYLSTVFPDYTDSLLEECGLVIRHSDSQDQPTHAPASAALTGSQERGYDRFRDRIIFPIRNVKGICIGFGGRVLGDEKPKYLNSPETPLFSKGLELYGLFEARETIRQQGFVLVTEGYMDVVALAQMGFANAVATLGTACTSEHVRKLFRFSESVVFSFDGDAAGRRAARKALEAALPYATDTRSVKFLFLPAEHDPDSYIRTYGNEAFGQQIQQALPLSRFVIETAKEGCDLQSTEGRARLASQAASMWHPLPEGVFKRQLLDELARLVQIAASDLQGLWDSSMPTLQRSQKHTTTPLRPAGYAERHATTDVPAPYTRRSSVHANATTHSRKMQHRPSRLSLHTQADHALRYLLADTRAWDTLSHTAHDVLLQQPAPHGSCFAWIESQYLHHGAQPWSALRVALQNPEYVDILALAERLMQSDHRLVEPDQGEFLQNVHALHLQQLKQQQAMAYAQHDLALATQLSQQIVHLQQAASSTAEQESTYQPSQSQQ